MSDWVIVLALASMSFVTTATGFLLASRLGDRPALTAVAVGFSAGIMVTVSIWELLPQAFSDAHPAIVVAAATFGGALLGALHLAIPHTHLVDEYEGTEAAEIRTTYLVMFGLVLHDVPEGFALAASYTSAPSLGVLIAIAIAAHNLPEGFAMGVPASMSGRRWPILTAALLAASAEPVGALIGLLGVVVYPGLNATFLALAAGAMIFVSVHELYPMARRHGSRWRFGLGALMAVGAVAVLRALLVG